VATLMEDPKLKLRVASMPHADKAILHVYSLVSEMERDFISARTKAALQMAKLRGVKLGGDRHGALARANEVRRKAADETAGRILKLLEPMQAAGTSLRKMAEALNATGLKTSTGGEWSAMAVKRAIVRGTEERGAVGRHSTAIGPEMADGGFWGAIQRARRLRGE